MSLAGVPVVKFLYALQYMLGSQGAIAGNVVGLGLVHLSKHGLAKAKMKMKPNTVACLRK